MAVSWLARRTGPLGPVHRSRTARLLRAGGYGLVFASALVITYDLRLETSYLASKAQIEVPVCAMLLTMYMLAFVTTTARRSAASTRTLAIGGGCGAAAAAVWLIPVLAWPPLPTSSGAALAVIAAAAAAAAMITSRTVGRAGASAHLGAAHLGAADPGLTGPAGAIRPGEPREAVVAALAAATIAALVIFASADGLLQLFPHWVADTSPANVPAVGRLANNIAGDEDHWFGILFLGALLAAVLSTVNLASRVPLPGRARAADDRGFGRRKPRPSGRGLLRAFSLACAGSRHRPG